MMTNKINFRNIQLLAYIEILNALSLHLMLFCKQNISPHTYRNKYLSATAKPAHDLIFRNKINIGQKFRNIGLDTV